VGRGEGEGEDESGGEEGDGGGDGGFAGLGLRVPRARVEAGWSAPREGGAAERAIESAAAAEAIGARIEAARSRSLAGRAMLAAGETERASLELAAAADELDACGAIRARDEAEQALRKLGHRDRRRRRAASGEPELLSALTARELDVARLVVARKTNPEIAAELFLSQKTVETHLRNMFRKLDVPSRVELARAVERAEQDSG
jgi:DNA-binding CsgD family transcriptional regulator